MNIVKIKRDDTDKAKGLVVVIDVLRAFTTAAFAFAAGAEKVIVVKEVEEAKQLHEKFPDTLIMGEVHGAPVEGFHYCNSPSQIRSADLKGKTLIQRTSCGTQGVVNSIGADHILVSSFVVATATVDRIRTLKPSQLTLMITGKMDGSEDVALADYLEACLDHKGIVDEGHFLNQVMVSPTAKLLNQNTLSYAPKEDLDAALCINKFPFAMEVFAHDDHLCVKPVTSSGEKWSF